LPLETPGTLRPFDSQNFDGGVGALVGKQNPEEGEGGGGLVAGLVVSSLGGRGDRERLVLYDDGLTDKVFEAAVVCVQPRGGWSNLEALSEDDLKTEFRSLRTVGLGLGERGIFTRICSVEVDTVSKSAMIFDLCFSFQNFLSHFLFLTQFYFSTLFSTLFISICGLNVYMAQDLSNQLNTYYLISKSLNIFVLRIPT
jgi:hypothetical protein